MSNLNEQRAASTIGEWSRARACCLVQLHAIIEIALAQYIAICPCNVASQRAKSVVSLKKQNERSSLFRGRQKLGAIVVGSDAFSV